MRKTPPPQDFEIHVDPSCLADYAEEDATMSAERIPSNQSSETIIHHDSETEEELKNKACANEETLDENTEQDSHEEKENSPPPADVETKEAEKEQEAATSIVDETHDSDKPEDAVGTETMTEEDDKEREARERRIERIQAEIQAAARAVVANIHNEQYDGNEDSVLSAQTDKSYDHEGTELTYDGTEASHDDREDSFISDHDAPSERHSDQEGGDSSSHHDGDVDDDVFSNSDHSKRSSMNSLHSSNSNQKHLTSPMVGEEAASASEEEPMSRIPSASSYMRTPQAAGDHTPSKVLSRPPFRTPSSVRAMQMSSPTASLFSSPRSMKRHMPTVSRIGTPNSQFSPSKRTPTRLKPRKAAPLVLLHVTVLPLLWPYSYLMSLNEVPQSLQHIKESWRLLQDKIGDTVLERGILLSHPQESYDVLEERLYEALELPVRPRAKILKCGHYMGPLDPETPSSDEEGEFFEDADIRDGRKWCDICGRDVRVEEVGDLPRGEKRFTVKIYASNGLMRAGAWEAAWREMERVDVELEPFVDSNLRAELEHLASITPREVEETNNQDDGFEDEEVIEHVHDHSHEEERQVQDARAREKEEMISRMAKEEEMKQRIMEEDEMRKRIADEEEMHKLMAEEEELKQRMAEEHAMRRHVDEQEAMRQNEERMREIYGQEADHAQSRRTSSRSSVHDDSSFAELLLAAFKVVLRDSRNIAIGVLSILVLLLALCTKTAVDPPLSMVMDNASIPQITTTVFKEASVTSIESIQPTMDQIVSSISSSVDSETLSSVTTTVVREFTVTKKVPVETSTQSIEVISSVTDAVYVSQVTTTVFREKTVTERIPVPTTAGIATDPCEHVISSENQPIVEVEGVKKLELTDAENDVARDENPQIESNEYLEVDASTEESFVDEAILEDPSSENPVQKILNPDVESAGISDSKHDELETDDTAQINTNIEA